MELPEKLKNFIENQNWIFAKTYSDTWPHEYIVKERVDNELFLELANHIDQFGYEDYFYEMKQIYFKYNELTYWHMGNIINRCEEKDTYRHRKAVGKLPGNQMKTQSHYQEAIKFATAKHVEQNQTIPGTNLPYVVHLSNVAMEILISSFHSNNFNLDFAVQVALLHDTLEDTFTTFEELETKFGVEIAKGVLALTKNEKIPKEEQIKDCLKRIKLLQPEVSAVKLADRITNLQPPPPHWDKERKITYRNEARLILHELKDGNEFLAKRLEEKIEEYGGYIKD